MQNKFRVVAEPALCSPSGCTSNSRFSCMTSFEALGFRVFRVISIRIIIYILYNIYYYCLRRFIYTYMYMCMYIYIYIYIHAYLFIVVAYRYHYYIYLVSYTVA